MKAIEGIVPLLEEKGMSDNRINNAVSQLARILPNHTYSTEEIFNKAVAQYVSAIISIPAERMTAYLRSEREQVSGLRNLHPAMIGSRAFPYRGDIDHKAIHTGRPELPEREFPDRSGEEIDNSLDWAYEVSEGLR